MILCDTNVLIALLDERDPLHDRAIGDLTRIGTSEFAITEPVMSEACFLMPYAHLRARLSGYLENLSLSDLPLIPIVALYRDIFKWLARYAEHTPDWADAHMSVLCGYDRRMKIWTYDEEFHTIWRRLDGSRIPLARKSHH